MRGEFPRSLDDMLVDREQTYRRLKFGDINGATESSVLAAQDQALGTNYFKKKVLKIEAESKCRPCKEHHLTSGSPVLAKYEYTRIIRHDTSLHT
jgi:hypothetical protein